MDDQDRARFVHDLYEFNDVAPAPEYSRRDVWDLRSPTSDAQAPREKLVDVLAWCIMDNHYHLLLQDRKESGTTAFLRKLNIGYAKYFNERYERSGSLFQGRTKKVLIEQDAHFLYLLHYIHFNPLDLDPQTRNWRTEMRGNLRPSIDFLNSYRWSSYLDYCGKQNFPSIISKALYGDVYGDVAVVSKSILQDREIQDYGKLQLE